MTAEQIACVTWEAVRAFQYGLGNTDTVRWDALETATQIAHTRATQELIVTIRSGRWENPPDAMPPTYKQQVALIRAIITTLLDAS